MLPIVTIIYINRKVYVQSVMEIQKKEHLWMRIGTGTMSQGHVGKMTDIFQMAKYKKACSMQGLGERKHLGMLGEETEQFGRVTSSGLFPRLFENVLLSQNSLELTTHVLLGSG